MKKIFFIDLDGVLVTPWSMAQELTVLNELTSYEPYSKESVSAMNMIIDAIKPQLVIHSSRRYQYSVKEFELIWRDAGIKYDNLSVLERYSEIDDQWCESPNAEKAYDINKFIDEYNIGEEEYIILEDEKLSLPNLFLLNGNIGLRIGDAKRILKQINTGFSHS